MFGCDCMCQRACVRVCLCIGAFGTWSASSPSQACPRPLGTGVIMTGPLVVCKSITGPRTQTKTLTVTTSFLEQLAPLK